MYKRSHYLVAALALTAASYSADAAGFRVRETNGSAIGYAMAGIAAAPEGKAAEQFENAATLGFMDTNVDISAMYLNTNSHFKGTKASNPFTGGGAALNLAKDGGNGGGHFIIPAAYVAYKASKSWSFGLGITTPFGLVTEYNREWIGKSHGIRSELRTININPAVAWRINDYVSIGAAWDVQHAKADLSRNLLVINVVDADPRVKGDSWGYGGNFGLLVAPTKATKIGLGWRTSIQHTIKGDIRYNNRKVYSEANMRLADIPLDGAKAKAKLKIPDIVTLSGSWDVNPAWRLLASIEWTRWSTFKELRVRYSQGKESVETSNYKDSFFYALGALYQHNKNWGFRFGVAYDVTPTNLAHRSVRIPDENRMWFSGGAKYAWNDRSSLSLNYTYVYSRSANINQSRSNDQNAENFTKGDLVGSFDASSHIVGLNYIYKF